MVTTSRADYTSYRPVLREMVKKGLELQVLVSGSHLEESFGLTVSEIEDDKFPVAARIPLGLHSDRPVDIARATARALSGFAQFFESQPPGLLVVLGDRYEMHAAALAALHFLIPVAHIHGGELTQGAIDDSLRHGMTKMSHLHFPATTEYGLRLVRLGEEPWRVVVSGAPSLDNLQDMQMLGRGDVQQRVGLEFVDDPLVVTYHPVTLDQARESFRIGELLHALDELDGPIVFTAPNADVGGSLIRDRVSEFVSRRTDSVCVENLGPSGYFGLMDNAKAMIGNSSSGIIEAASFHLPVVNVGARQRGRIIGKNVISVGDDRGGILEGIGRAISPAFREQAKGCVNPYGDGAAAERIVGALMSRKDDGQLLHKNFYEGPVHLEGGWDGQS